MTGEREAMAQFFREVILAHALTPVGRDKPIEATHRAERDNPLCGDHVVVRLRIEGDNITDAAFSGEACSVCMAASSLLCEHAPGMTVVQLRQHQISFCAALDDAGNRAPCPDYLAPMLGLRAFPARTACAALPWETAVEAANIPV